MRLPSPLRRIFPRVTGTSDHVRAQELLERKTVQHIRRTQSGRRFPSFQQLKYLPTYLSNRERLTVIVLLGIIVVSLGILGWRWYGRHTVIVPAPGGTYVEGLIGTPRFVNPILADVNDADRDLSRLIFSGLMRVDEEQRIVPDLAAEFSVNDEQTVYTFVLRDDVRWHNDEQERLDAYDVVFTFRSIQDPDYKSPLAVSFAGVDIEALDDRTVQFTLPEPFTPFLSSLTVGILPEHLWTNIPPASANLAELNLKPIGTGAFAFASLTKESTGAVRSFTLERNEHYHGPKPFLQKLTFKFYPDLHAATEALRNRNIEGLSFVAKEDKESLVSENKDLAFYNLRLPQYTAAFFNQKKHDALKDKTVRQALGFAIDKQRVIDEALRDEGEIIHAPILPGFLGHNPAIQGLAHDPDEARTILDEAGWTLPDSGEVPYRTKGETTLQLTLTTVDQPEQRRVAEVLKEEWEAIGFAITLNLIAPNRIQQEAIKPREYQILLFGEIVGLDPDPYPFWHSSQNQDPGLNLAVFANNDVDQLLEEARQTNDPEQRRLKYLHFQNILAEEKPAIFLFNPFFTYAIDERIQGIMESYITTPADRFQQIRDWYIYTDTEWR